MSGVLKRLKEASLRDLRNVISLPGSEDGRGRSGSQASGTIGNVGPGVVHVSHSRPEENKEGSTTSGIYGQSGESSSASVRLQEFLGNRLAARLGKYGSPECDLSWKNQDMPWGAPIFVARASQRLTLELGTFLWPTPQARDHFPAHKPEYIAGKREQGHGMSNLPDCVAMLLCLWPTPTAITNSGGAALCKWGGTRSRELLRGAVGSTVLNGALNPSFPLWLMGYPDEWENCAPREMPSSRSLQRSLCKRT